MATGMLGECWLSSQPVRIAASLGSGVVLSEQASLAPGPSRLGEFHVKMSFGEFGNWGAYWPLDVNGAEKATGPIKRGRR